MQNELLLATVGAPNGANGNSGIWTHEAYATVLKTVPFDQTRACYRQY